MKDHLKDLKSRLGGKLPSNIIADVGYGSEENYEYLSKEHLGNYVKYNTFHKEATAKWKSDPTRVQNWEYSEQTDEYICGFGRVLKFQYIKTQKSKTGYRSPIRVYQSDDCQGCPHHNQCIRQSNHTVALF